MRSRDALIEQAGAEDRARSKVGPGTDPGVEMGPLVTGAAPRQGERLHRLGVKEGAKLVRRRPRASSCQGTRTASSSAADAVRRREARDAHLPGGDLRAGAVGRARARLRRKRASSSTSTNSATAPRSSPATADTARDFASRRRRSAWSASTCRSRCRWRSTASAAGSARSSATPHARHGGRALLHPPQDHDDALADRHPRRRRVCHADDGVRAACYARLPGEPVAGAVVKGWYITPTPSLRGTRQCR